jgi:hypothetical protein
LKVTSFSEFVKELNELFNEPINQGGSPSYPAGDFATSDAPQQEKIYMSKKYRKNRYVRSRK